MTPGVGSDREVTAPAGASDAAGVDRAGGLRVLVPVAHPANAEATCATIRPFLDGRAAEVVFVNVVERNEGAPDNVPPEVMVEEAREVFAIVSERCTDAPWAAESELLEASTAIDAIFEAADELEADVVAFTPRPGNRLTRLLSGNYSRKLIDRNDRPVIVFPHPERDLLGANDHEDRDVDPGAAGNDHARSEIIVAFNASAEARRALTLACSWFRDATIRAVHVTDRRTDGVDESMTGGRSGDLDDAERHDELATERLIDQAREIAGERGVDLETSVLSENVGDALITYAEEGPVEAVVMGRAGDPSLRERFLGGLTRTVVDGAPVPVVVVP